MLTAIINSGIHMLHVKVYHCEISVISILHVFLHHGALFHALTVVLNCWLAKQPHGAARMAASIWTLSLHCLTTFKHFILCTCHHVGLFSQAKLFVCQKRIPDSCVSKKGFGGLANAALWIELVTFPRHTYSFADWLADHLSMSALATSLVAQSANE